MKSKTIHILTWLITILSAVSIVYYTNLRYELGELGFIRQISLIVIILIAYILWIKWENIKEDKKYK